MVALSNTHSDAANGLHRTGLAMGLRQILLLRHAEALPASPGGSDSVRILSPQGESDANSLGQIMVEQAIQPDCIFLSPARRTARTFEILQSRGVSGQIEVREEIYEGYVAEILDIITSAPDNAKTILIVGHNSAINDLVHLLVKPDDPKCLNDMRTGFKPAMLCTISCAIDRWQDLKTGVNDLKQVIDPSTFSAHLQNTERKQSL
jgi:phosphohistidine phosphatase